MRRQPNLRPLHFVSQANHVHVEKSQTWPPSISDDHARGPVSLVSGTVVHCDRITDTRTAPVASEPPPEPNQKGRRENGKARMTEEASARAATLLKKNQATETRTHDTKGARTPSQLKRNGGLRFLGRCPQVLGMVARQLLGWSPVSLSRDLSCASKLRSFGRVCRSSCWSSFPRHLRLMFHGIRPEASEYRYIKKIEQANIGRDASGCQCRLIKPTSSSCSLAHEEKHDVSNDTEKLKRAVEPLDDSPSVVAGRSVSPQNA